MVIRDPASMEQTRALAQERSALVGKSGFLISAAFLVARLLLPAASHGTRPIWEDVRTPSFLCHAVATAMLAAQWLASALGRPSARRLAVIDALSTFGVTVTLALMGALIPGPAGAFQSVLAISIIVSLRAIALPSTALRTVLVSTAALVGSLLATYLVFVLAPPVASNVESPAIGPRYVLVWMGVWLGAFSAVATLASRVIYGLRAQVREARRLGQYVLHDRLGAGGMGIVYRATHAMLRRDTAIKLLPPAKVGQDTIARFEREVRQTARLAHPNTVAVYDYGRTPDGVFYYAMEYLEGLNLHELVDAVGALPPGRVVHFLVQICGSLSEAHGIGLVHRDIKPGNVMVSERGGIPDVVKVLDFGLVKDLERGEPTTLTATGTITGTPLYLAPEVIRSPADVGPASDLYAVAGVGYFLLTGTHVFEGKTAVEVCAAHLHAHPEPPSVRAGRSIPAGLEALVLAGLAKDPSERPRSAREMCDALLACDVGPWTEADAMRWWEAVGRGLVSARKAAPRESAALAPTLAVDLAHR
jgi:hypothetical protein